MQASHVHKGLCTGPNFLYSPFCYSPDRGDSECDHLPLGFQHLIHMQVSNIKFLGYGHDLQLGNGAAFLPRVPFPRVDILKQCLRIRKGLEEHLVSISLVM